MDARFAVYRLLPECEALDYANDVLALSQEGRTHLERAYQAHVMSDWAGYLHETEDIQRSLLDLRDTARRWADDVMAAPAVCPDQIALPGHGFAA